MSSQLSSATNTRNKYAQSLDPVNIIKARLSLLQPDMQELLHFAACFGAIFSRQLLAMVAASDDQRVESLLDSCVRIGFIEPIVNSKGRYKFIHDKVQQAAYELTNSNANKTAA